MWDDTDQPKVLIRLTAHGKPYYESIEGIEEETRESPLHNALDFPGKRGRGDLEAELKARYPGIEVSHADRAHDFVEDVRSLNRKVNEDEFVDYWRSQVEYHKNFYAKYGSDEPLDPFRRLVNVKLSGPDRVRPWSGWFHYPLLIEETRREMIESGERFAELFERPNCAPRDVIEEAYLEQVLRERLAIFERRKEWWRVIRWGATTALGLVLAFWSGIQIWDWFVGC